MVYSVKQMYDVALADVIKKGPRIVHIDDKDMAAYALGRKELLQLFVEKDYQPKRSTWLTCIEQWRDLFDVIVPKGISTNKTEQSFIVIFSNVGEQNLLYLRMFAEDNNIGYYPVIDNVGGAAA